MRVKLGKYPLERPVCKFETLIKHPNILKAEKEDDGSICLGTF